MPRATASQLELDVRPLTADSWPALAALFEEGGDPRFCWCMYWRLRSRDFGATRAADNRTSLHDLTFGKGRGTPSEPPGLVGYHGDRAVGWVSLGPRDAFERLRQSRTIPAVDDRPAWSIVCFVVSRRVRGGGVARGLLDAAVDYARSRGARTLEAYPIATDGRRHPSSSLWSGTLGMFEAAGFAVAGMRVDQSGRPRDDRPIVRREL